MTVYRRIKLCLSANVSSFNSADAEERHFWAINLLVTAD